MKQFVPVIVLTTLVFYQTVVAESLDEKLESICGTNPVLKFRQDTKEGQMDAQMLIDAEKCAEGRIEASILKRKLTEAAIEGCLVERYGYQKEFIQSIAKGYDEAFKAVEGQMPGYERCVDSVRECGRSRCEASFLPKTQDAFTIRDLQPVTYHFKFTVLNEGSRWWVSLAEPCGGELNGKNYNFYVSSKRPEVKLPVAAGCTTFAFGSLRIKIHSQRKFLYWDGGMRTTDGTVKNVKTYIMELS